MEFDLIWNMYPRKVCKKPSLMQWLKLTLEQQQEALEALPAHVKLWEATQQPKEFIPHLRTWLYQERWTDEIELPKAKEPDWWASEQGIMEKARQLNITPRPGESWFEVKGRINLKLREAA